MISLQRVLVRAVALSAILTMPAMIMPDAHIPHSRYEYDSRVEALAQFLQEKDSPIAHLAEEFLIVADKNGLDWRLLPSIAFLESSAGKVYKNNNIFGWNNAETSFASVREGIHYVGSRLGTSEIYRGKSFEEKLALYNSYAHYAPAVIRVADTLSRMEREARTRTRRHIRLLPDHSMYGKR
ncbi:MAG: hypothetical protein LC114_15635 [Bryobacterales bacterium]|nr:hypothetical protein [Bryobacterales bacterium]